MSPMRRLPVLLLFLASVSLHAQVHQATPMPELMRRLEAEGRLHFTDAKAPTPSDFSASAAKTFTVTARQFSFTYDPSPFVVNQGDSVTLNITVPSNDGSSVGHGFFLEQYNEQLTAIGRGKTVTISFVANVPGTFTVACSVSCGELHGLMTSTFTVNAVTPPTITSFTPTSGSTAGGTNVQITGTNFQTGATVRFGTVNALSVTVNSATSINVLTPGSPAGSVPIIVTNPDGTSATSAQSFQFVEPGPSITSISPNSGATSGGTQFTISGSGFQTGATVTIGGLAATNVTVVSATTITAKTPLGPSNIGSDTTVPVVVRNPDGSSATRASGFTWLLGTPSIASVSPYRGAPAGGVVVTIFGSGFTSGLPVSVKFGGTSATNVTVLSPVVLTAVAPAHADGTVDVVVQVGSGSATASGAFTYAPTPPKRRSTGH